MPADRRLDAPVLTFDLAGLLIDLKRDPSWETARHTARTLVKSGPLRIVLVALRPGATLPAHRAEMPVAIHVVAGRIVLRTDGETVALHAGQLLALQPGVVHAVQAEDESAFVLTLAGKA